MVRLLKKASVLPSQTQRKQMDTLLPELPTYCERCGRTFTARYDTTGQCVLLWCEHCQDGLKTSLVLVTLPESQQKKLHRLLERTTQARL